MSKDEAKKVADTTIAPVAPERGPRKPVVSKDLFLNAYAEQMKKMGVCFKVGKTVKQPKSLYWQLFIQTIAALEAGAAASGSSLSLSGVGVAKFKQAGKREETRYARFKFTPSTKARDFFHENSDLVATEMPSEEDFMKAFAEILASLAPLPVIEAKAEKPAGQPAVEAESVDTDEDIELPASEDIPDAIEDDSDDEDDDDLDLGDLGAI